MITALRSKTARKIFTVVVWITVVSMAGLTSFIGIFKRFFGNASTSYATVNSRDISHRDMYQALKEVERQRALFQMYYGDAAPDMLKAFGMHESPEEEAFKKAVRNALILESAEKVIPHLHHDFVAAKIHNPYFLINTFGDLLPNEAFGQDGSIHMPLIIRRLQSQNITTQDFEQMVEQALKRGILVELVRGSLYVPSAVVRERYIRDFSKKNYAVIELPIAGISKELQESSIPDEELKAFYDRQNAAYKTYWTPEYRSGTAWIFSPKGYSIDIPEKDVTAYYERNKSKFIEKEAKIDSAGKEIEPVIYKPLSAVKSSIISTLHNEAFLRLFMLEAKQAIGKSVDHKDSIATFAQKRNGKEQLLTKVTAQDQGLAEPLFGLKSVGQKTYGSSSEHNGYIVTLTNITPRKQQAFEEVKNQVRKDYTAEQAYKKLESIVKSARTQSLSDIKKSLQPYNATYEETGLIAMDPSKDVWKKLEKKGAPVNAMQQMTLTGQVVPYTNKTTGFIVTVLDVEPLNEDAFVKEKPALEKALYQEMAQSLVAGFIASLHKDATIKKHEQTPQQVDYLD